MFAVNLRLPLSLILVYAVTVVMLFPRSALPNLTRNVKRVIRSPPTSTGGWPFTEQDLRRHDETPDSNFYREPRFVTHIDDGCIESLRDNVYKAFFKESDNVLDVCSSWISHYPDIALNSVVGVGMNEDELQANARLSSYVVQDLNSHPALPFDNESFEIVTNAVSVDYLSKPKEIFLEIYRVLKPGGIAIMSFSNRMFPTKVVNMWLSSSDEQRIQIVMSYFMTCGARFLDVQGYEMATKGVDPLFVVTARKPMETGTSSL